MVTRVLLRATGRVSPPATVIMVSELNHDTEPLLVIGGWLKKRGFKIYFANVNRSQ